MGPSQTVIWRPCFRIAMDLPWHVRILFRWRKPSAAKQWRLAGRLWYLPCKSPLDLYDLLKKPRDCSQGFPYAPGSQEIRNVSGWICPCRNLPKVKGASRQRLWRHQEIWPRPMHGKPWISYIGNSYTMNNSAKSVPPTIHSIGSIQPKRLRCSRSDLQWIPHGVYVTTCQRIGCMLVCLCVFFLYSFFTDRRGSVYILEPSVRTWECSI